MNLSFDEFKKVELRVGEIKAAEKIPETDKLLRLRVDFGTEERQIVSGIAEYFPVPETLVGRRAVFVTNLEPRTIRGEISNGMILAAKNDEHFSLLEVGNGIAPGTLIG